MKTINHKLLTNLAGAVKKLAILGSGAASIMGSYQPKVPTNLQK